MKRKLAICSLILGVVAMLSMVVCANPAASAEWKWPRSMTVVTPTVGTANYSVALAWGSTLEEKTKMSVRVITQASSIVRIKWVTEGMGDLAMAESHTAKDCLEGLLDFRSREAGPFEMRLVWTSQIAPWGFPVKGDSPIKTVHDIKPGTKIGFLPPTPFFRSGVQSLLAMLNLSEKDVILVPMGNYPAMARAIIEGKIDTCLLAPNSSVTYEIEATPGGIRWLPIPTVKEDPEGIKRWLRVTPIEVFSPVKFGVKSALGINMVLQPQVYITKAGTSPELIYHLTRWLDENLEAYKGKFVHADLMSIDLLRSVVLDNTFIPIHEGTVRYLKEKGMWTAADDARQAKNAELVTRYTKAYQAAIKMADEKKIKVDPTNEQWTQLWDNYKKELKFPTFGL